MRSERAKGGDHVQGDSKGRSPWRAFGDFPRDGKVTRVQGGAPAGGCRDYQSRKSPRVRGGAPASVGAGTAVPQKPAAKKEENTKGRNRMGPPFCREWAGKPGSVMMTIYLDRRSPGGSSHIDRWLSPQKARRAAALLLRSRCCFG